jgi:hypothetical protein
MTDTPTPLPSEVMNASGSPSGYENLPLHLRVLRAIVAGHADEEYIDRAVVLANEIYELEAANVALEEYRSAS